MEKFEYFFRNLSINQRQAGLIVAIFDSSAQSTIIPMDKVKYDKLYESINNMIFLDIDKRGVAPTFAENKHVRGAMKVKCSTPEAKSWLTDMIQDIPPLWPNMQLRVVDFGELPQRKTVLGLFPHCKLSSEQILRTLNTTDPRLDVDYWTILGSKMTEKGVHVAFCIDKLQMDMLRSCKFKLHFGAGYVLFKDISKKQKELRDLDAPESNVEVSTTIDIGDIYKTVNEQHPKLS